MALPVPPFRVDIRRTACRAHSIAPTTLTAKVLARACAVTVSTRAKPPVTPAWFTSPLIGPSSRSAVTKSRTISGSQPMSARTATARPPAETIWPTTSTAGTRGSQNSPPRRSRERRQVSNRRANAAARPGHDQSSTHFVILALPCWARRCRGENQAGSGEGSLAGGRICSGGCRYSGRPRARFLIQIGVPTKPNAARI